MPADPFTPAELEAGAEALAHGCTDPDWLAVHRGEAELMLAAVAPLIAARARAETVRPYEQRVAALEDLLACYRAGLPPTEALHRRLDQTRAGIAIARAHRTTPGDDHA